MPELTKKTVYEIYAKYLKEVMNKKHRNIGADITSKNYTTEEVFYLMRKAQAEIHKRYQWNKDNWSLDQLMEEI